LARLLGEEFAKSVANASPTLPDGRYLPWDELRHRPPPDGLTHELWWAAMRVARRLAAVPVKDMGDTLGRPFSFVEAPAVRESLHLFDRQNVSAILAEALGNEDAVTEYRVRLLIEEAISSSAIEGARPTTRELARQMVREQREPTSKDERMILNNWRAMQRIVELRAEGRPLALSDLLELHRIIGDDALDVPDGAGELRGPSHEVDVADHEGTVWHVPPPAEDSSGHLRPLRERVEAMLAFANGDTGDAATFIHPVLRAIISHFWLGYEHPFRDGNGRMARALYYWVMLRHGYEMAEFLSISGPIDRKPTAYYRAFTHVETDEGDLTYFILHQLGVLREAQAELLSHLRERSERAKRLAQTVSGFDRLNHRQRALLQTAIRHPLQSYTIEGHAAAHRVHYHTARTDLDKLVELGFLAAERVGKRKRFSPSPKLARLVEDRRKS
jgi:Fic family protein